VLFIPIIIQVNSDLMKTITVTVDKSW